MMTGGTVYSEGWKLSDVRWDKFDASRVDPELLASVKAASLVEYNAPDYVTYLKRVFRHAGQQTLDNIEQWGREEIQHGEALGKWAEIADPGWSFQDAFRRFRAGYKPPHFASDEETSVRGSRRGEMIARCVVESGTSSFYSAIREAAGEPVLAEIAGRIAADEFRHYKLFYETLQEQDEEDLPFWRKLLVALTRVNESDDDELSYAYYCANVPAAREAEIPYVRNEYAKAYHSKAMTLYRHHHIRKLTQMVAKAIGADPKSRITDFIGNVLWRLLQVRAGISAAAQRAAA